MDEGRKRMAEALTRAWERYVNLFGAPPHGSVTQIAALLELCPEAKEYVRLYEKQRTEGMTL